MMLVHYKMGGGIASLWRRVMASLKEIADAILRRALLASHPVGSYYWSSNSTDPGTLFGGTWEQVKDRFVYAVGDDSAAGDTGGEATHTLTVSEMPAHTHDAPQGSDKADDYCFEVSRDNSLTTTMRAQLALSTTSKIFANACNTAAKDSIGVDDVNAVGRTKSTKSTGGGTAHNNMPPYVRAYCWRRTA